MKNDKLIVLGCRGSMPVCEKDFLKYGGATSSFLLQAEGETILLDAGTGILKSTALLADKEICHLLLGHMHMDHIIGIAFWRPLFTKGKQVHIYSEKRDGMTTKEQIANFLKAPYWPVGIELFQGVADYHDINVGETFHIGDVMIKTMRSNHPNEGTLYRVEWDGKSVVYAIDFEHSTEASSALAAFARNADVLIYDSTYAPETYPQKKGWGHSTWVEGLKLKEAAGVKTLLLAHHEIDNNDEMLDALQAELTALDKDVYLAKEGMEIAL
ncbi:MAG: MBL fold metallo-hydrolase [Anaerotignum sp.]|nr:MBL fold metallo-hydrolase [Anaerotignum sp.]